MKLPPRKFQFKGKKRSVKRKDRLDNDVLSPAFRQITAGFKEARPGRTIPSTINRARRQTSRPLPVLLDNYDGLDRIKFCRNIEASPDPLYPVHYTRSRIGITTWWA